MQNKTMNFFIVQILFFLLFGQTIIYANELPENILEKFNASSTGEEALQYLTGIMKSQFSSLDKETQVKLLEHNHMKSYQAQTVHVNDALQFVFITSLEKQDGVVPTSSQEYPIIYEFTKENDEWKISNLMSGHIIIDLFKRDYSPDRFHTKNSFQFDGKNVEMNSAFAYFNNDSADNTINVTIRFYPFKFYERDIEYFKFNSGIVKDETGEATTIASSVKYPIGELTLYLDENKKMISYCVNGYNFNDQYGSFNYCLQPSLFPDENMTFSESNLKLITKGDQTLSDNKSIGWDINIDLPLFKEGIN